MNWLLFVYSIVDSLAWPAVVVTLVFMLRGYLPKIGEGLSSNLKIAKYKGAELHFEKQLTATPRSAEQIAKLESVTPKEVTNLQADIRGLIETQISELPGGPEDKIELLTKNLAFQQAMSLFDRINNTIFGSQVELLRHMNSKLPAPCKEPDLVQFYDAAKEKNPEQYKNYSFENYMFFLESFSLVTKHTDSWAINDMGIDYLMYLASPGPQHAITKAF